MKIKSTPAYTQNGQVYANLTITRQPHEKRCPTESAFFYRLKKVLRRLGYDVIKKNPQKDGHMVSAPYYLRHRLRHNDWIFMIYDHASQVRLAHVDFNAGEIELSFQADIDWRKCRKRLQWV